MLRKLFLRRPHVADVPGCLRINPNPDPRALATELARIELTESTFLLLVVVLGFLVWVGAQIGKTERLTIEAEYGAKKKKSSGSSSGGSSGSLSRPNLGE
jgi:hypothetical protein